MHNYHVAAPFFVRPCCRCLDSSPVPLVLLPPSRQGENGSGAGGTASGGGRGGREGGSGGGGEEKEEEEMEESGEGRGGGRVGKRWSRGGRKERGSYEHAKTQLLFSPRRFRRVFTPTLLRPLLSSPLRLSELTFFRASSHLSLFLFLSFPALYSLRRDIWSRILRRTRLLPRLARVGER